jgi:hypothetical protein
MKKKRIATKNIELTEKVKINTATVEMPWVVTPDGTTSYVVSDLGIMVEAQPDGVVLMDVSDFMWLELGRKQARRLARNLLKAAG